MSEKLDFWEKIKIASSIFSSIILVIISMVIKSGADSISQNLDRGDLMDKLVDDLINEDKIGYALLTLDSAIEAPQKCSLLWPWDCLNNADKNDPVIKMALGSIRHNAKVYPEVKDVIFLRMEANKEEAERLIAENLALSRDGARSSVNTEPPSSSAATEMQQSAQIALDVLASLPSLQTEEVDPDFADVRLVYIQYRTDRGKAEAVQQLLQEKGMLVPGLEQVNGIAENSIRYANPSDEDTAKRLQALVESQGLFSISLINLEDSGYQVPNGQFEIWLKD